MDFTLDSTSVLLKQPDTKLNNLKQQLAERDQEILHLQEQLKNANQEVESRSRDQMTLLGNMNHEIRTPMNGIIGMAALLAESPLGEKQQRYTKAILESSRSLFQVLSDTMDLAELENGRASVNVERFDYKEMTEKVLNQVAPQAAAKGVELICASAPDVPENLKTDCSKLGKLLCGLISDAIKLTQDSHVFVQGKVSNKRENWGTLRFEISHAGSELAHNYLDKLISNEKSGFQGDDFGYHGIGTSLLISQHLSTLLGGEFGGDIDENQYCTCWFEVPVQSMSGSVSLPDHIGHSAVFQINNDRYLEHQLLSLNGSVDRIVSLDQLLDGYCDRESQFDRFIIDIDGMNESQERKLFDNLKAKQIRSRHLLIIRSPENNVLADSNIQRQGQWTEITKPYTQFALKTAIISEQESLISNESGGDAKNSNCVEHGHILVVEDNRVNQLVAKSCLQSLGYEITIANDGIEAIEHFLDHHFDLVLMDIRMPRMDGVEATQELKKMMMRDGRSVPVIALTANASLEAKEKYIKLGLDDYLAKPIQTPQLNQILQKWLAVPLQS